MSFQKYSKEWVDWRMKKGEFRAPSEEELNFAYEYPMLLDPDYVWGGCPHCSRKLRSSDIRPYEYIVYFMHDYSLDNPTSLASAIITCDNCGHARGTLLVEFLDNYQGPDFPGIPERLSNMRIDLNAYFQV